MDRYMDSKIDFLAVHRFLTEGEVKSGMKNRVASLPYLLLSRMNIFTWLGASRSHQASSISRRSNQGYFPGPSPQYRVFIMQKFVNCDVLVC